MSEQIGEENVDVKWLEDEQKELDQNWFKPLDKKPALKMEENKLYEIELVNGAEWRKYIDPNDANRIKKIIPVIHEGVEKVFFLSTANPLYKDLVTAAFKEGQRKFKIIRIGQAKGTRYKIVK